MLERLADWLRANGIDVDLQVASRPGSAPTQTDAVLHLRDAAGDHTFLVQRRMRAPYPNEVPALLNLRDPVNEEAGRPLLSAPYVSEGLARSLREAGWSWADDVGNLELRSEGLHIQRRVADSPPPPPRAHRVPRWGGGLAIVRFLINHGGDVAWGPSHLANIAGVSQPRASQVLAELEREDLVTRVGRGEWIPRRDALLDAFLSSYPGPGGTELSAYSLDPPLATAMHLSASIAGQLLISADVGPDLIVPVRRPTVLIVYTLHAVDLNEAGLVRTPSPSEANVFIRAPADKSVFGHHETLVNVEDHEVTLVDPIQMVWDLEQLGGHDRREAAGEMRSWILNR